MGISGCMEFIVFGVGCCLVLGFNARVEKIQKFVIAIFYSYNFERIMELYFLWYALANRRYAKYYFTDFCRVLDVQRVFTRQQACGILGMALYPVAVFCTVFKFNDCIFKLRKGQTAHKPDSVLWHN